MRGVGECGGGGGGVGEVFRRSGLDGLQVEKSNQPPLSGRTPRIQSHVDRLPVVSEAGGSVSPGSLLLGISSFSDR